MYVDLFLKVHWTKLKAKWGCISYKQKGANSPCVATYYFAAIILISISKQSHVAILLDQRISDNLYYISVCELIQRPQQFHF